VYRSAEFKDYFLNKVGAQPSTYNTYNSYLSRIDKALGGLDEKIKADGTDAVVSWAKSTNTPPFDVYPSHARSVLKRYLQFLLEAETPTDEGGPEDEIGTEESGGLAFRLQKEMHAAVRKQLPNLEAGLVAADGGSEVTVATGKIDIVARDAKGKLAIIELKAGSCPPGAMEQALGYAQALSEERDEPVRAILIASDFPDRVRASAKRVPDLELLTYEFLLKFNPVK
jgi:hypothetical protein